MNFEIQNNSLETDEIYVHKHLTKMKVFSNMDTCEYMHF